MLMFARLLNHVTREISTKKLTYSLLTKVSFVRKLASMSDSKMSLKPKIFVTRTLHLEAMSILHDNFDVDEWKGDEPVPRQELLKRVIGKEGLLVMLTDKIDEGILNAAGSQLKVISTMSAGLDHLDVKEIRKQNVRVGNTPVILGDATAEFTVALLLATSRRMLEANEDARKGAWPAWSPYWMCGQQVTDSIIGIVGFGHIGQEVALRLKPFKPKEIIYYNRTPRPEEAKATNARNVNFDELLQTSDFIIATIALTPETAVMFNRTAFAKMKSNCIFINTSRGAIVHQDALIDALMSKKIAAAGLDVVTPEPLPVEHILFTLRNCVVMPHIGSGTTSTRNAMAFLAVENLIRGMKNEKMPAEVK